MNPAGPHVSVVIPFHRKDDYVERALCSVLNQSVTQIEIILMNDGVDYEYGERLANLDPVRIRHMYDGENRGLAYRLNESLAYVRSAYYARMDADDIMTVDRLSRQLEFMRQNPEVAVLGTSAWIIDSEDRVIGLRRTGRAGREKGPSPTGPSVFIHPSVMFSTDWLRGTRYAEHLKRIEDKELWVRGYREGSYAWLDEPLLFYRVDRRQRPYVIRQTAKEERQLARSHVQTAGWLDVGRYYLRSYSVELTKLVLEAAAPNILAKRRLSPISEAEKLSAQRALRIAVDNYGLTAS